MMHVSAANVLVGVFSDGGMRPVRAGAAPVARPDARREFRPETRKEIRPDTRLGAAPSRGTIAGLRHWIAGILQARAERREQRHLAGSLARLAATSPHLLDDIGVVALTDDMVEIAAAPAAKSAPAAKAVPAARCPARAAPAPAGGPGPAPRRA